MAEPPNSRSLRSRAEILDVATAEFARRGYAGARVDEIAALTSTTKRMIYYYFGGKEELYRAVLERASAVLRPDGATLADAEADPFGVVLRLAALTYERYRTHPDLGRVLIGENLAGGPAPAPGDVLPVVERALRVGAARGLMRPVEAEDLLMVVDALCQFAISSPRARPARCGPLLTDVVTAYLAP